MNCRKLQSLFFLRSAAILTAFFFILFQISCHTTSNSVTRQNFSTQYQPEEKKLRPKYCLYNVTDSLTRLFFSVNSADLLYAKNQGDEGFSAHILLTYIVHPVEYTKAIADSGSIVLSDAGIPGEAKLLSSSVDMDILQNGKYFLEVTFRDLNKMTISYELIYLDHSKKNARNNFLITAAHSETPLFKTFIDSSEEFSIRYFHPEVKKLFVKYYKNRSGPASPPYSYERKPNVYFPDSTYWMEFSSTSIFKLKRQGWYTFNTDSISTDGVLLSRFDDGFPKITVAKQMVYPLRYLTMHDEYVAMDTATNCKKAVDKFWLNSTGSEERARTVIRDFYNRVEIANTLFSTQIEGWKTDRGMIYLAFGPPQNVYRTAFSETWIYGNTVGPGSLTLVFEHKENAFTDQEFVLVRNEDYKVNWITAVDSWRQGHVYTLR